MKILVLGEYQDIAIKSAIDAGVNFVDVGVGGPEVFDLDDSAKAAGITVIPNLGLDPGLDRICQGYASGQLDKVTELYLWCGGLPPKEQQGDNPLGYKISWAWHHTIGTYRGKAQIIRDGNIVKVDKFDAPNNPEIVTFPQLGECEAFLAGTSFDLIKHLNLTEIRESWNKTVRWKGHCDIWKKLIGLHMLDLEPLPINLRVRSAFEGGHPFDIEYLDHPLEVSPFEFFNALGEKYLQYKKGEGDVVVLRTKVVGEKNGQQMSIEHELIDFYDQTTNVTSMGRTTAYPASILSQMIARGEVTEHGVIHCGKFGQNPKYATTFFADLAKRNIIIKETISKNL